MPPPHRMGQSAKSEETILAAAVQRPTPAERSAYLDEACAGDPKLRRSVEELLQAGDAAGAFLDESVLKAARTSKEADVNVPAQTIRLTFPDEEGPGTQIGRYKL